MQPGPAAGTWNKGLLLRVWQRGLQAGGFLVGLVILERCNVLTIDKLVIIAEWRLGPADMIVDPVGVRVRELVLEEAPQGRLIRAGEGMRHRGTPESPSA